MTCLKREGDLARTRSVGGEILEHSSMTVNVKWVFYLGSVVTLLCESVGLVLAE